ncbi:hypothetical protein DTQ32_02435 [Ureaplasma parvum]|nr:hypothetical protein DTQ32_02435 [Ureaplasma parvum]
MFIEFLNYTKIWEYILHKDFTQTSFYKNLSFFILLKFVYVLVGFISTKANQWSFFFFFAIILWAFLVAVINAIK